MAADHDINGTWVQREVDGAERWVFVSTIKPSGGDFATLQTWHDAVAAARAGESIVDNDSAERTIAGAELWAECYGGGDLGRLNIAIASFPDADAWPIEQSEGIITAEADICGVHAVGRHGRRAHAGEGEVGAHCLRASRHALETIANCDAFSPQRGWFAFPTTNRGTEIITCEDGYFCWLARQAGFRPIKVAPMGHLLPIVVLPTDDPDRVDYRFPAEAALPETTGDA